MKFRLTNKHLYWWPVTVSVPHPDKDKAGEMLEMKFRVQFAALPREEANAIAERIRSLPVEEAEQEQFAELKRVVKDWDEDVIDDDDAPIPFSADAFNQLLEISWYRLAIYRAFAESMIAQGGRRGN